MSQTSAFNDLLEAVDALSSDQQKTFVNIVQQRIAHEERERLVRDVLEAQEEIRQGGGKVMTVAEIMREIES